MKIPEGVDSRISSSTDPPFPSTDLDKFDEISSLADDNKASSLHSSPESNTYSTTRVSEGDSSTEQTPNENNEGSSVTTPKSSDESLNPLLLAWGSLLHSSLGSSNSQPNISDSEKTSTSSNNVMGEDSSTVNATEKETVFPSWNNSFTTWNSSPDGWTSEESTLTFNFTNNLIEESVSTSWNISFSTTENVLENDNSTLQPFNTAHENTSEESVQPFLQAWGSLLHSFLGPSSTIQPDTIEEGINSTSDIGIAEESTSVNTSDFSEETTTANLELGLFNNSLNAMLEAINSFLNHSEDQSTHVPPDNLQTRKPNSHVDDLTTTSVDQLLGAWGSLLHAAMASAASPMISAQPMTPPPKLEVEDELNDTPDALGLIKQRINKGARTWYSSDKNCKERREPGQKGKILYSQKEPSTLCKGQGSGSWLCYCSGRQEDDDNERTYQYCGNCTATFIPEEINTKPLINRAKNANNLVSDEKLASINGPSKNGGLDLVATLLAKVKVRARTAAWEWAPRRPDVPCEAMTEQPVPFAVSRPSAVCEMSRLARACLCARNRGDRQLKEVCGRCDYLLRVQTIDGQPVGDQTI